MWGWFSKPTKKPYRVDVEYRIEKKGEYESYKLWNVNLAFKDGLDELLPKDNPRKVFKALSKIDFNRDYEISHSHKSRFFFTLIYNLKKLKK